MLARREIDWQQYNEAEVIVALGKKQAAGQKLNFRLRRRCLIVAAALTLFAAVMTARSDTLNQAGFDLVGLKETASSLMRSNDGLQVEIAKLQSLERIKTVATQQLGMQQAMAHWYIKAAAPEAAKSGQDVAFVKR